MGSSPAHQHFSDPTLVAATDEATGVAFTVAAAVVVAAAAAAAAPVAVVGYAAAGTSCAFPPTTTAIAVPDTAVAAAAVVGVSQIFHIALEEGALRVPEGHSTPCSRLWAITCASVAPKKGPSLPVVLQSGSGCEPVLAAAGSKACTAPGPSPSPDACCVPALITMPAFGAR
eukprot:1156788-Pelagomonas_calceolata.AAC.2